MFCMSRCLFRWLLRFGRFPHPELLTADLKSLSSQPRSSTSKSSTELTAIPPQARGSRLRNGRQWLWASLPGHTEGTKQIVMRSIMIPGTDAKGPQA